MSFSGPGHPEIVGTRGFAYSTFFVSTGRPLADVVLQRGAEGAGRGAQAPLLRVLQPGSVDRNLQQPAQVSGSCNGP